MTDEKTEDDAIGEGDPKPSDPPDSEEPTEKQFDWATAADDAQSDQDDERPPFAELAAEIQRRDRGDRNEGGMFEEMETDDLDPEDAWAALQDDETVGPGEVAPVQEEARTTGTTPSGHVLNKRQYCQRCPYFSDPPEVSCGHEGTEIVEVVGADEFRVRGCPMVGKTRSEIEGSQANPRKEP